MPQQTKALLGAATRYIASRNAVQTVYWRSSSDSKFVKVSKTFNFGKSVEVPPPEYMKNRTSIRF